MLTVATHSGRRESPLSTLQNHTSQEEDDDEDMDRVYKLSDEEMDQKANARRTSLLNFDKKSPFKAGSLGDASPQPTVGTSAPAGAYTGEHRLSQHGMPQAGAPSLRAQPKPAAKPSSSSSGKKRISLNTLPQQALRQPSIPNETAIASSGSASPKPAPLSKFSSSFAGRTKRPTSTTSAQRSGDSGGSSARGSASSQAAGRSSDGASTTTKSYEDGIVDFVADLEKAKNNTTIGRPPPQGHIVDLSPFRNMRDPNGALADDMASSSLLQASTPPSRRLSNVPDLSTSSPPSRGGLASHAPHVRSRLSAHSIAEEPGVGSSKGEGAEEVEEEDEPDEPFIFPMARD